MPAKVTAIQFFSLLLLFFLSLFYFHPMVPAINIFYKYQLYQLLSRKRATPSQDGSCYLFGRHHIHSRAHPPIKNPQSKKLLSLVTSSSVTSRVKEFWVLVVGDHLPHQSLFFPRAQIQLFWGSVKVSKTGFIAATSLSDALRYSLTEEKR